MVNSFKVEVELKYIEILAQLRVDNFIQFEEPETEPLDLSMSKMCGGKIELPDVSIPEVSEGETELSEINQEDTRSLNIPIQEAGREQTSMDIYRRKSGLREKTTHTTAKQFKCEKEDFVALPNTHVMNHPGKKPYYCPKYGNNFIRSSSLNAHKKILCDSCPIEDSH
ncbi:hypothetical protein LOAG_14697 [Loa loa]|uniref:C2H2-type domain-containing protein n=1 Tax=Loa loa TaxID=7209 RepID=A0A1I7V9M5_LOALO|nr:hypothetical protein LOAG_14697 [Loa loa]EFO13830.2 hypothetical protein LOAG_14697 [Loa loa]